MLDDVIKGLVISSIGVDRYDLPTQQKLIEWKSGNGLLIERSSDSGYRVTYHYNDKTINLNSLLQQGTHFYLTKANHMYLTSGPSQIDKYHPEVHIPLPKIEKDEGQILEIFHEIGHDRTKREMNETVARMATGETVDTYLGRRLSQLPESINNFDSVDAYSTKYKSDPKRNNLMEKWEERQAWFYALKLMRELQIQFHGLDTASKVVAKVQKYLKSYMAEYSLR